MKKQLLVLATVLSGAAIVMVNQASAETSTTTATTVLASADSANNAANVNTATIDSKSDFGISYLGAFAGPGLDFHAAKQKDNSDMFISNRPSFKYSLNETMDAGLQARIATTFKSDGITAANENYRIFMNIKKLMPTDLGSLTLTPRAYLPTSDRMHNYKLLPSPELIAQYSIEPKDSRFSFNVGAQFIKFLYQRASVADSSQQQFYALGIAESAYQISPKTQATFAFYPELVKMSDLAMATSSNEFDLGLAIKIFKGWNLNPFIATEMNSLNANNGDLLKSSGLSVFLTGTFL